MNVLRMANCTVWGTEAQDIGQCMTFFLRSTLIGPIVYMSVQPILLTEIKSFQFQLDLVKYIIVQRINVAHLVKS